MAKNNSIKKQINAENQLTLKYTPAWKLISNIFVAEFHHVFVCCKRYRITIILPLILKYLAQQTDTYSRSVTETLKQDVKSVKS